MVNHPAVMNAAILESCKSFLPFEGCTVLDPFAGTGSTAKGLPEYQVTGVEIEHEWAEQHPSTICGDSLKIVPTLGMFDAILTSPCYGNRMADDFNASDGSKRLTYRHRLGRPLSEGTASNLHFGRKNRRYEELHEKIWTCCVSHLKSEGRFILNCKDFIARGKVKPVTQWHIDFLKSLKLKVVEEVKIPVRGMRFGANSEKRISYERVICFER